MFIGRTEAEVLSTVAEATVLWPPKAKPTHGKDSDAGKD